MSGIGIILDYGSRSFVSGFVQSMISLWYFTGILYFVEEKYVREMGENWRSH